MSTSINIHDTIREAKSQYRDGTSWLSIDTDGGYIAYFMPYEQAKAIADAINASIPAKLEEVA